MDSYREYLIRCYTCGSQIACFSKMFELLSQNDTIENALKNTGINNYCCRSLMMNPTIVTFNMENRELIEGFKNIEDVDEADSKNESTSNPIFSYCLNQGTATRSSIPMRSIIEFEETDTHPVIPDLEMSSTKEENLERIPLNPMMSDKFEEPILVGFPTINHNILKELDKVYVGAKKYSQILNGRTYFAR